MKKVIPIIFLLLVAGMFVNSDILRYQEDIREVTIEYSDGRREDVKIIEKIPVYEEEIDTSPYPASMGPKEYVKLSDVKDTLPISEPVIIEPDKELYQCPNTEVENECSYGLSSGKSTRCYTKELQAWWNAPYCKEGWVKL